MLGDLEISRVKGMRSQWKKGCDTFVSVNSRTHPIKKRIYHLLRIYLVKTHIHTHTKTEHTHTYTYKQKIQSLPLKRMRFEFIEEKILQPSIC